MFKYVACDCVSKSQNCFSGVIRTAVGSCTSDVTAASSCKGVQFTNSTFSGTAPVSTNVTSVSAASLVSTTSSSSLQKRAVQTANYDVVPNAAGSLIGQIIGNGVSYSLSQTAVTDVTVCLPVDSSIPKSSAYTIYDIAEVSSAGAVSCPYYINTTISGTSICGSVPAFKNATFVPVLRNSIAKNAVVAASTTTTVAITSSKTSGNSSTATSTILSTMSGNSSTAASGNNNAATDSTRSAAKPIAKAGVLEILTGIATLLFTL